MLASTTLAEGEHAVQRQQGVLGALRRGMLNLVVCSAVAEEGLDLTQCALPGILTAWPFERCLSWVERHFLCMVSVVEAPHSLSTVPRMWGQSAGCRVQDKCGQIQAQMLAVCRWRARLLIRPCPCKS